MEIRSRPCTCTCPLISHGVTFPSSVKEKINVNSHVCLALLLVLTKIGQNLIRTSATLFGCPWQTLTLEPFSPFPQPDIVVRARGQDSMPGCDTVGGTVWRVFRPHIIPSHLTSKACSLNISPRAQLTHSRPPDNASYKKPPPQNQIRYVNYTCYNTTPYTLYYKSQRI